MSSGRGSRSPMTWAPQLPSRQCEVSWGAQVIGDLEAPAPFEAVRGALEEFAVLAHVRAVSVGDEQDGAAGLPAGVDDVLLRRNQALVPGQHHGPAGLAELVEHVDHDDAGGLGVDVDLTLQ